MFGINKQVNFRGVGSIKMEERIERDAQARGLDPTDAAFADALGDDPAPRWSSCRCLPPASMSTRVDPMASEVSGAGCNPSR
jgi:hypothetical protein